MRKTVLIAALALSACQTNEQRELNRSTREIIKLAEDTEGLFIIHVPSRGCPEGWSLKPEMFQMGEIKFPACFAVRGQIGNGRFHVDYLRGGEAILQVPITIEAPAAEERPTI